MPKSKEETEYAMVRAFLKKESGSDRILYDYLSPVLYPICLRYGNNSMDANDMFQDSMVRIFQRLSDFRFQGSMEGWAKKVCVNQCLDILRKKSSFKEDSLSEDHIQVKANEVSIEEKLFHEQLLELLHRLPSGYRTVFNMYVIEGYSHQEIAEKLGITESTSKTQLFKARKQLQRWMNRD